VYLIPRKFDLLIENMNYFTSFETLCGFIKCKVELAYKNAKYDEYEKRMSTAVSLSEKEFGDLKKEIIDKFESEYECERMS